MEQAGQFPPPTPAFSVELHCHSTASDGSYPPAQVVAMAAARGLSVLALTDHDTVAGIPEAATAAAAYGIALIPGVELSCSVEEGETHLLGYFVRAADPDFLAALDRFRGGRDVRGAAMVEKLNALGVPMRWERVKEIADGAVVTRPHIARALIEVGAASSIEEAFDTYLVRGRPVFVDRIKLSPADAVRLVRAAGGVPVLAHPLSVADLDATLAEMVPAGLGGIEAYYGAFTPEQHQQLARLANTHGLLTTGGSDFHGEVHAGATLGEAPAPLDVVDTLMRAATRVRVVGQFHVKR